MSFDRERLAGAASDEMIAAADVADMLVRRGVPFRQSHGIVAGLVREAVASGRTLSQLSREELGRFSEELDHEYYDVLSQQSWLESKVSEGGTALDPACVSSSRTRAALDEQPRRSLTRSTTARWSTSRAISSAAWCATASRRGDRRDRGVPPHRAGLPRVRRA